MNNKIHQKAKVEIAKLAKKYASKLKSQTDLRVEEMQDDDTTHFLVYRVLGVGLDEGKQIDVYQNKGRFLYKYAGSFLEEAAILCFKLKFPHAKQKVRIPNSNGQKPKTFEIDCLVEKDAYEIKWRDATTDGDHITKEHTRVKTIKDFGLHPIRIMFYYPNREQAKKIQATLQTIYEGLGGKYFFGDTAWCYVREQTEIDLLKILEAIACENDSEVKR